MTVREMAQTFARKMGREVLLNFGAIEKSEFDPDRIEGVKNKTL